MRFPLQDKNSSMPVSLTTHTVSRKMIDIKLNFEANCGQKVTPMFVLFKGSL